MNITYSFGKWTTYTSRGWDNHNMALAFSPFLTTTELKPISTSSSEEKIGSSLIPTHSISMPSVAAAADCLIGNRLLIQARPMDCFRTWVLLLVDLIQSSWSLTMLYSVPIFLLLLYIDSTKDWSQTDSPQWQSDISIRQARAMLSYHHLWSLEYLSSDGPLACHAFPWGWFQLCMSSGHQSYVCWWCGHSRYLITYVS